MAGGDDLILVPDSTERSASRAQDLIGVIIGPLQGQDDPTAVHPGQGGTQEVCWQLIWQLLARVVFAKQRKCRSIYDLIKLVKDLIYIKFLTLQKLI
jgi:hypothetical protein